MSDTITVLPEPSLEFNYEQYVEDPHDGLTLFGPYDKTLPAHKASIVHAVVGPPEGIDSFASWSKAVNCAIVLSQARDNPKNKPMNPRLWPAFPGFEAAFSSVWTEEPVTTQQVDRQSIIDASRDLDPNKRTFELVNAYLAGIQTIAKRDERPDVIVCVVPEEVWINCRPESNVLNGIGTKLSSVEQLRRRKGQTDLFGRYSVEQYQLSVDFRRQIKARIMEFGLPIQIVRESTLRLGPPTDDNKRGLTPLSDRAWNLSTALYYKAGGKPWRLGNARDGVCYIGTAFRKTEGDDSRSASCAAQMFLDSGDGIVFMGEYGPWYSPANKQFHLDPSAAHKLLAGVLKTYYELQGKALREVFLHSRSDISKEEFEGYLSACPSGVKLVGIRVRQEINGIRFYRPGQWPTIRGTFWRIDNRTGFLWGSGFKERLVTYDGTEIPIPLRIDIQHGEHDIEQVARDILGLTKLNYNTCRLGEGEPVTIGYSDAVGEILVSNPTVEKRSPNFKFYI